MSIIEDLNRLKFEKMWFYFLFVISTICPGFLVIYLYKNHLFFTLDIIKLIIFSIAITSPILIHNIFIVIITEKPSDNPEQSSYLFLTLGSVLSSLVLYFSLSLAYIFILKFKDFVITILVTEVLLFLFLTLGKIIERKARS